MRPVLAMLVALLGYYCIVFSLAQALMMRDPRLAHRLAPYEGRITAQFASLLAGTEATVTDRASADALARQALRQDPTAVVAVSTLGIDAQIRNDTALARRVMAYALTLSRRDLITQLWAIEDAVGRGDVVDTLRQYDITLRTKPSMSDLLFPVLASAATDPAIRAALLRTLIKRPVWGERYVSYVAATGRDPRVTAALLVGLRHAEVRIPDAAHANVVNALLSAGSLDEAWSYYATIRERVDRRHSRDFRIAGVDMPSQLDWTVVGDGGVTATIQDWAVDFASPASVGGPILRQVQLLPPGDYHLTGHIDGLNTAEDARPYWTLICQDGRDLGRVVVPNSGESGNFSGRFSVPPKCPSQTLLLIARPADAAAGVSGRIDRMELAPAR